MFVFNMIMKVDFNQNLYISNNRNNNNINFKGYDARPLRNVVMTTSHGMKSFKVIKQMSEIGKKHGFDVLFTNPDVEMLSNLENVKNAISSLDFANFIRWAQDHAVVTPNNKILSNINDWGVEAGIAEKISHLTGGKYVNTRNFIAGGNVYYIKNKGKNELLIGKRDVRGKFLEDLKRDFDVSRIYKIPQADFHIDLFLRPLKDRKILLADDSLTVSSIANGIKNISTYLSENEVPVIEKSNFLKLQSNLNHFLEKFKTSIKTSDMDKLSDVARVLVDNGFEVINVPGRLYDVGLDSFRELKINHYMNYMNSIVHEKPDGTLIYITNKSNLNEKFNITPEISKKIDFDFEKIFLDKLEPYVKRENVYFINNMADDLYNLHGGIHCLCNEIPKDIPSQYIPESVDNYVPVKIGLGSRIINFIINILN